MNTLPISFFVLVQIVQVFSEESFPQKCDVWDSDCLSHRAQSILSNLVDGDENLGIGKLDPLVIDSLTRDDYVLKYNAKNITIQGLGHAFVKKINVEVFGKKIRLVLEIPILTITSNYTSSGVLNQFSIESSGDAFLQFFEMENEITFDFDIVIDQHADKILDLKGYHYWFDAQAAGPIEFTNLYNGDEEKSAKVHQYINKNWKKLWPKYGRVYMDGLNENIFVAFREYLHTQPITNFIDEN